MIQKVDHIGIAVRSLEETIPLYEKAMGLKLLKTEEVETQKVKTAFFEAGETHIELLEPTSPESPIAKFIEKNGEGIHHVALGTDDIMGQLELAAGEGIRLINETPMAGAGGKQVAFLHPKSTHGVLTEFCSH
jgi:methylmalonyl-CoA/ethylmalonyl-CoA epimerase